MKHIKEIVHKEDKRHHPNSERSWLIQGIANAIGVPFENVFTNVWHIKGIEGNKILKMILEDTLAYSTDKDWRARKASELIKKSRPIRK